MITIVYRLIVVLTAVTIGFLMICDRLGRR